MKNWMIIGVAALALTACKKKVEAEPEEDIGTYNQVETLIAYCDPPEGGPVIIEAAEFQMGDDVFPEEGPIRTVEVGSFNIDVHEVTNKQFAEFVDATGYVTDAEKEQPLLNTLGGAVFVPPSGAYRSWWRFVEGANWYQPEGPDSTIAGKEQYPVVQVSYNDAKAYAQWKGRRLPTEAEWEYAAGVGALSAYVWGDEKTPDGEEQANTWQGTFPVRDLGKDGHTGTAPVGCFKPNAFGLYDMIGNVWEWTDTLFAEGEGEPAFVIKGGSFLCADNFCQRFRSGARQPQEIGLPTNHIGFRTAGDVEN